MGTTVEQLLPMARMIARREFRRLGSLAKKLVVDEDDLYQSGVLGMLEVEARHDAERSQPQTYFQRRCRGAIWDFLRSYHRHERADVGELSTVPAPCSEFRRADAETDVERAICSGRLNPSQRRVVSMVLADIPQRQIARNLGVTPGRVSQIKSEAYAAMRRAAGLCCAIAVLASASLLRASSTGGAGASMMACLGGPPDYCARTDTALMNGPSKPWNDAYYTATPLTGSGNLFIDPDFGSPILRVTDFTHTQTSGTAERKFRTPSASEQNPWMSDSCGFWAIMLGGGAVVYGFDPVNQQIVTAPCGSTPTTAPLTGQAGPTSTATVTAGTLSFAPDTTDWGYQAADNRSVFAWGTVDGSAANDGLYKVDLVSGTPYTFGGVGHNTQELQMSSCTGLTYDRVFSHSGAGGNEVVNKYMSMSLDAGLSRDDTISAQSVGFQADNIPYVVIWKSGSGCRWIDTRTGTMGGQWGASGTWNSDFAPLAAPAAGAWGAANVTATTGGSLTATDTYKLCVTYTITNVGETPCGPAIAATPGAGNTALSITSPANVAGASPLFLIATGWNLYACDQTVEGAGCAPHLQADKSVQNSTTPLPTLSVACNANCTGTTFTMNYQAVMINGSYRSAPSAAVGVTTGATGLGQVNNAVTVTNVGSFPAANFTLLRDDPTQSIKASTTSPSSDTGQGMSTFIDETVAIGTSMTFGLENTATQAAPSVSSAGWIVHNAKLDAHGWLKLTAGQVMPNRTNHAPGNLIVYLGDANANTVFTAGRGTNTPGEITDGSGAHQAMGSAVESGRFAYPGCSGTPPSLSQGYIPLQSTGNISTDVTAMNAGTVNLAQSGVQSPGCNATDDSHFSWNDNLGGMNGFPIVGALYPDNPYDAVMPALVFEDEIVGLKTGAGPTAGLPSFRFAHNWTAALASTGASSDFNKTARGNLSIDGRWYLFTSSALIGSGLVNNDTTTIPAGYGVGCSGPSGANSSASSDYCEVLQSGNANSMYPRADVFLVRLR